jgi:hypothetical protein
VGYAYTWFGNTRELLRELFDENAMSVPIVAGRLAPEPDGTAEIILNLLALAAAIVAGFATILGTGGADTAVVVAGVAALISSAFTAAALGVSNAPGVSIQAQLVHLQEQLVANREQALASNDVVQIAYLQHWGLLKALGEPIQSLQLTWPVDLTDRMAALGRRGYELTLWQTLSPTVWFIAGYRNRGGETYAYHYTGSPLCTAEDWLFVQHGDYKDVDEDSLDRLFEGPFHSPNGDPTGPLGVPLEDLFLSRSGWHLDGYLTYGCNFEPPSDLNLLRRHRPNPSPVHH